MRNDDAKDMIQVDELVRTISQDAFLINMFQPYIEVSHEEVNKNILDFGCGYGWGSAYLSHNNHYVVGYDIDEERIRYACNRYKAIHNLQFTNDDDSINDDFDCIVMFHVFHELQDIEATAYRISRILKENNRIYLAAKLEYEEQINQFKKALNAQVVFGREVIKRMPLKDHDGILFEVITVGR